MAFHTAPAQQLFAELPCTYSAVVPSAYIAQFTKVKGTYNRVLVAQPV